MRKLYYRVKYFLLDIKWKMDLKMIYISMFHIDPMDEHVLLNEYYGKYEVYLSQKRKDLGHE